MFGLHSKPECRKYRQQVGAGNIEELIRSLEELEDRRRRVEVDKYRKKTGGGPSVPDATPMSPTLIRLT